MPKATFYTHVAQPAVFACRLAARAIRDGGRVLVWSDSADAIARLDRDLWQQDAESFIPHEIWQPHETMPSETPVLLATGHTLPTLPADITVLNLSPDFWTDALQPPERVLEIVGNSLEDLAEARERFRAYRQSGFDIEHHKMEGKA
ncbi:DNA polymerase III subunit chi [Neisseria brasiliensis]|uniref:DNA polymerase III subunit chi n=1 Tax=Neisseria TaxID=482 RepID=UPI000C272C3C|nr:MULTISPECIES: DNA polymerase III subunit chi [Neisseria]PJO78928.1 DNA polymerase III subunit chi [Neisseria sp. N177_16]QGL26474.1 DNA polymerase III subunit chi [Neisseria brasiliensis]